MYNATLKMYNAMSSQNKTKKNKEKKKQWKETPQQCVMQIACLALNTLCSGAM